MIKVAINGFGRIGRITARHLLANKNVSIVAINDLTDIKTLAHLFKYDSAQGRFDGEVSYDGKTLSINGDEIAVSAERDPSNLPWAAMGIDVVLECTGIFRTKEKAGLHLKAGAKKVVLSAPAKGSDIVTIVKGVNEQALKNDTLIVSNASCTTNCAAPIIKAIHDVYNVKQGVFTTIHAYTADQKLQDAPHVDLRRARAAAVSIIPTTTGAAQAVASVIPELKGKLEGMACRVPVPAGSFTDFTLIVEKDSSAEEINDLLKGLADNQLKGIVEYVEDEIVSSDIVGNAHSSIVDASLTHVFGKMIKLGAWYDNEYGYSARLAEVTAQIGE